MKNKSFLILSAFIFIFFSKNSFGETFNIQAEKIKINKKEEISIFENKVVIKDENLNLIKSEYAEFNKIKNFLTLKNNVIIIDKNGNEFYTEHATYDKNNEIIKSRGKSKIVSTQGYVANTSDLIINKKKILYFQKMTPQLKI